MVHPSLALLLALLAVPLAQAGDEDSLNGSYEVPPAAAGPESNGSVGALPNLPEPPVPEEEAQPDHHAAQVPLAEKPSLRFNLDERLRFRRWLTTLCRQEPVSSDSADRVRFTRDKPRSLSQATNKQGSLLLLLENYAELEKFHDDCETRRIKDPAACVQKGRLPRPWESKDGRNAWTSFGSLGFWTEIQQNRTPAGLTPRTDLLAASDTQLKSIEAALKKSFFELRDAADLDGKPGSAVAAQKIVEAVRAESTCGTRAVSEGPERQRSPAQK